MIVPVQLKYILYIFDGGPVDDVIWQTWKVWVVWDDEICANCIFILIAELMTTFCQTICVGLFMWNIFKEGQAVEENSFKIFW